RDTFVKQGMRPDNDLGLVAGQECLGSARLQRVGCRILRRRISRESCVLILRPNPLIVFIWLGHTRIPWISQGVMKPFRQIVIRSNVTVESFFLPNRSGFSFSAIDFAGSEGFQRMHQLSQ